MTTGEQRQVVLADTPELVSEEDTWGRTHELLRFLDEEERKGHSHPLLRAIARAYWPNLLLMQVLGMAQHFMGLLAPLLLKQVLVFQEAQQEEEKSHSKLASPAAFGATALSQAEVTTGIYAVLGSILLGLVVMIFASQVAFYQSRLTIRIGQALRGAVLARCVQGQLPALTATGGSDPSGKAGPSVYNVISFDMAPNIEIIWVILAAWLFPFQFITTLAVLFQQVHWAIVPGVAVIVVAEIICGVLLYKDGHFRHALLAAKDERLGRCDEAFNNIRTLQMLAWTGSFEKQILEARNEELRVKNLRLWMNKMVQALGYVLAAAVTLVTLAYFVTNDGNGTLKASIAVPVIGLVTGLIGPFAQFPTWIQNYLVWRSAYTRLNKYMGLNDAAGSAGPSVGGAGDSGAAQPPGSRLDGDYWEVSPCKPRGSTNRLGAVVAGFKECSLTWAQPFQADEDLNQEDDHGRLIGRRASDTYGTMDAADSDVECGTSKTRLLGSDISDATLQDLELEVKAGELLTLVGKEGEGKSSVLSALLGEMPLVAGAVFSPAIARRTMEAEGALSLPDTAQAGRALLEAEAMGQGVTGLQENVVAFAPQEPAIYTGTLRSNVLFGCRHDPSLYEKVLNACQLEADIARMPLQDLSDLSQGGATLSGGQKARVSLARAVYRAALDLQEPSDQCSRPLVLLDEPFCALDHKVAQEIVQALFQYPEGLLVRAAVVVTTVDPWWLSTLGAGSGHKRIAVLRGGRLAKTGRMEELRGFCAEFPELEPAFQDTTSEEVTPAKAYRNPQEDSQSLDSDSSSQQAPAGRLQSALRKLPKKVDEPIKTKGMQTEPAKTELASGQLLQEEHREKGHVKSATYFAYFGILGHNLLAALLTALCGIMLFQELTALWISYWSAESRPEHFLHPYVLTVFGNTPSDSHRMLWTYAALLAMFTISAFSGHILEIIGGIRAAREFFKQALLGTLNRPFRWWDSNPTGRVLNRFSEDVEVLDNAITCIVGVIFGAVLYFVGHVFFLAIANKFSLALLPIIAFLFEYIARYYRKTIREVHRLYLVSMSTVYQGMVEAIVGSTTIRAFAASQRMVCQNLDSLDVFMRLSFAKGVINAWVGLRLGLVGYSLSVATTLYPVLQYFGILAPRAAGLVGFSITYSAGVSAIIQQFIMNFSDLEMQLVSIERLREYANANEDSRPRGYATALNLFHAPGLELRQVTVAYREGLQPVLQDISLTFAPGESSAIVGRTGAGKSSMLLAILQMVPYTGHIAIDGQLLNRLNAKDVCERLVGVVPQHPVIFNGSIRWNLDPEGKKSSMELWRALEAIGLRKVILADGRGLEAPLGTATGVKTLALSQGQSQLLCAARVLLRHPRVVLLDEVSACLPGNAAKNITSALVKRFTEDDAAVLLVTHQADIAATCDHVVTVSSGHIVDATVPAMLTAN